MGWKKFRKKFRKTVKRVGKQIKRSAAVAAPALLGPGLGEKVGVSIAKTAGKTAIKSTYKRMGQVSNVTGRVVQVVGTAVATWFGGPILGSMAYRATALGRQLGQKEIKEAKFKAGLTTTRGHKIVWRKQPVRILEAAAVGFGGAIAGSLAGGTSVFASGSSMVSGIFGGGTAAAGGASPAMLSSTEAMVAGETASGVAAAAAPAAGSSLLTTAAVGLGGSLVSTVLPRLFGGGGGTSTGGVETGGVEVYTGEGGGAAGETGFAGMADQASDFLSSEVGGIPMALIVGVVAVGLIWYFA